MAAHFRNAVLADLVKKRLVTDLQQRRCLLPIPVGLLECLSDSSCLSFIFRTTGERLQAAGSAFAGAGLRAGINAWAAIQLILRIQLRDGERLVAQNQVPLHEVAKLA